MRREINNPDKLEAIIDKLGEEYVKFKEDLLARDKEEIFDNYMRIYFYNNVIDYVNSEDFIIPETLADRILNTDEGFDWLYSEFLDREYASVDCFESIDAFFYNLAMASKKEEYCYTACGANVEEVEFENHEEAYKFVQEHQGYDCIVEHQKEPYWLSR